MNIENAALTGTDRVELYTEPYATKFNQNAPEAVAPFIKSCEIAHGIWSWNKCRS